MERDLCFVFMTPGSSNKLNDVNSVKIGTWWAGKQM